MSDIFAAVTDRIIAALEAGVCPWHQPWVGGSSGCVSYATGKSYSLPNHFLLGGVSGEYITFNQCTLAGGRVRKGEKSKMVVFWKPFETTNEETGEVEKHFYLRYYNVFHLSQVEGVNPRWTVPMPENTSLQPDAVAENIIQDYVVRSGVKLTITASDKAFYRPSTDEVVVPKLSQYQRTELYYSTLLHEIMHSSGHHSRLNRISDVAAFGSHDYSREELCAELGSAFLVNHCGLETDSSFNNSAAYLDGWLKALKGNKKLIISAAGAAEKAVIYILGKEGNHDVEPCDGSETD